MPTSSPRSLLKCSPVSGVRPCLSSIILIPIKSSTASLYEYHPVALRADWTPLSINAHYVEKVHSFTFLGTTILAEEREPEAAGNLLPLIHGEHAVLLHHSVVPLLHLPKAAEASKGDQDVRSHLSSPLPESHLPVTMPQQRNQHHHQQYPIWPSLTCRRYRSIKTIRN